MTKIPKPYEKSSPFRFLPPHTELVRIAAKVLDRTTQQIEVYGQPGQPRTDAGDILVRLVNRPNRWTDKLELIATEGGGFQMMPNTRFHELRARLTPHGLQIACLEDHSGARTITSYRLCWQDEVSYRSNGRIEPFIAGRPQRTRRRDKVTPIPAPKPAGWQSEDFKFGNEAKDAKPVQSQRSFFDFETGRAR